LRKGWGYGKNYLSAGERLYNSSIKIIDDDKMTVYKGTVIHMCYIDVEIIMFKNSNIKRVRMRYQGDNTLSKIYDVSHCKSKKVICKYIDDVLLDKYFDEAYGIKLLI